MTDKISGKHCFTLMELLITIGVIVILAGMLLPGLIKARNHAMKAFCINNMKQIGVYCYNYRNLNNGRYPQARYNKSWAVHFMLSEGVMKKGSFLILKNMEKDIFGLTKKSGIAWCPAGVIRWHKDGEEDRIPGTPEESGAFLWTSGQLNPMESIYEFDGFIHYGTLLPGDNVGICSFKSNGPLVPSYLNNQEFAASHDAYYPSARESQIRSPSMQSWLAESQFGLPVPDVPLIGYEKIRVVGNQDGGDKFRGVWGARHGPAVNMLFCDGHVSAKLLDRLLEWGRRAGDERDYGFIGF